MKWFLLLPLWATFNFVAYFFAWLLAFFPRDRLGAIDNNSDTGIEPRLPLRLSWFDTIDNSLLGDGAWKRMEKGHWPWREKFAKWPRLQAWLGRTGWLMRNPAYGFERSVLSAKIKPDDALTVEGDPLIQDQPNGREGYCFVTVGYYWGLVLILRDAWFHCMAVAACLLFMACLFDSRSLYLFACVSLIYSAGTAGDYRCLKLEIGWKLKTYAEDESRCSTEPVAQYVFSPRISAFVE
jgi:hypothetical protein